MGHTYRELVTWQKAKPLAVEIYRLTEHFPKSEIYGLRSQIRRAAVSIASNIAEGQGRMTRGEFLQFLGHARGSLFELETQLAIALDLGYFTQQQWEKLEQSTTEVRRLLNALCESIAASSASASA